MKLTTVLFFVMVLWSAIVSCDGQEKYIKITPVQDQMELMYSCGEFGYSGLTEVYFLSVIDENLSFKDNESFKLKQGFVVVKLQRNSNAFQKNDPAYKLLDSLNKCRGSMEAIITGRNGWSEEEKAEIIKLRELLPSVKTRFYDHVKVYIEKSSLSNGISQTAFLKYQ